MIFRNFKKPEDEEVSHKSIHGDRVLLLKQSRYKMYSFLYTLGMILIMILLFGVIAYIFGDFYIFSLLTIFWIGTLLYSGIVRDFIDYYFYFLIVTPKEIIEYNQGFFSSNIRTINVGNLKTISIVKTGFFRTAFNFGYIEFSFEKDESVSINYIENLDLIRGRIYGITRNEIFK